MTGQELQIGVVSISNPNYKGYYDVSPDKMWSVDSTNYPALKLRPNSSYPAVLIIYLQEGQIEKVLLYPNGDEAEFSKVVSSSLRTLESPLPLLDIHRDTETTSAFSSEWLYSVQLPTQARHLLSEQEFMELQYREGKLSNFPRPEPLAPEEQVERERLGMLFVRERPLSELVIEDRGPY